MKDGVKNYYGSNVMNLFSTIAGTKMLVSFERHRFDRVTWTSDKKNKVKFSPVKCKHFLAVLLCFAKIFRESCVEK